MGQYETQEERLVWMEQFRIEKGEEAHLPPPPDDVMNISEFSAKEQVDRFNSLKEYQLDNSQFISIKLLKDAYSSLNDEDVELLLWECDGVITKRIFYHDKFCLKVRDAIGSFNRGYIALIKKFIYPLIRSIHKKVTAELDIYSECFVNKKFAIEWINKKSIPFAAEARDRTFSELGHIRKSIGEKSQEIIQDICDDTKQKSDVNCCSSILQISRVKKRVSTSGRGNTQVQYTCQENPEAVAYVEAQRKQGATPKAIAHKLQETGCGIGVIGCILQPTSKDVTVAREHAKYLLRKSDTR